MTFLCKRPLRGSATFLVGASRQRRQQLQHQPSLLGLAHGGCHHLEACAALGGGSSAGQRLSQQGVQGAGKAGSPCVGGTCRVAEPPPQQELGGRDGGAAAQSTGVLGVGGGCETM